MTIIEEPSRALQVIEGYDVVVAGGGIAGVSAALSAARAGAKVALLEKECGLGGLATLGNVVMYLPLCDGRGRQLIGGIGEELIKLSAADIREDRPMFVNGIPECWQGDDPEGGSKRYLSMFNPVSFQLELEAVLERESIEVFYDTRLCNCLQHDGRLSHVVIENKSGRLALAAGAFVDASGDADLCALAGERMASSENNVIAGWYYTVGDHGAKCVKFSKKYAHDHSREGAQGPFFAGHKGRDVSQHVLQTRRCIREKVAEKRADNPDEQFFPMELATIPCFRATRRLDGEVVMVESDMHRWFDDCIGMCGDWRKRGPTYAIPLRAIQARVHRNLFAAGRCISAAGDTWDVTRAIGPCAVTGEASGLAAAMIACEFDGDAARLEVAEVQRRLNAQGVIIDPALAQVAEKEAAAVG